MKKKIKWVLTGSVAFIVLTVAIYGLGRMIYPWKQAYSFENQSEKIVIWQRKALLQYDMLDTAGVVKMCYHKNRRILKTETFYFGNIYDFDPPSVLWNEGQVTHFDDTDPGRSFVFR